MSGLSADGLGQPWYSRSNTVGGVGGVLAMEELTRGRNFTNAPTDNWPPTGALFGMGAGSPVPRRDFVKGEITSASTLVDHAQGFGGRAVPVSDLVPGEYQRASRMISRPQAFGGMGGALPISDLVPGEYERASRMVSRPQAFGGMGAWLPLKANMPEPKDGAQGTYLSPSQVPSWDLESGTQLTSQPQSFGGLGNRALPIKDLAPGEFERGSRMVSHPQAFGGMGNRAVPISDLAPGEYERARRMIAHRQAFGGMGAGRAVPVSDLVKGEYTPASTLVDHAQGFGGIYHGQYGAPLPKKDLVPGELESARRMIAHRQAFGGMGGWVPFNFGAKEPKATQGTWLSPDQIPAADLESASSLIAQNQNFGGMGNDNAVPTGDFVPGELQSGRSLMRHHQAFGGLGQGRPKGVARRRRRRGSKAGVMTPEVEAAIAMLGHFDALDKIANAAKRRGQAAIVVLSQVKSLLPQEAHQAADVYYEYLTGRSVLPNPAVCPPGHAPIVVSGNVNCNPRPSEKRHVEQRASEAEILGGSGNGNYLGMGQFNYGDPSALLRSSYVEGKIHLEDICDPQTGTCLHYATPQEVNKAIGQKVQGQSALHQGQFQLPAFYSHPTLGPWGVDPRTAYQYWWAQQAAMQQAAVNSPLSIWGSPGFVQNPAPVAPSAVAQTATFNPYTQTFPVAGAAVEHF